MRLVSWVLPGFFQVITKLTMPLEYFVRPTNIIEHLSVRTQRKFIPVNEKSKFIHFEVQTSTSEDPSPPLTAGVLLTTLIVRACSNFTKGVVKQLYEFSPVTHWFYLSVIFSAILLFLSSSLLFFVCQHVQCAYCLITKALSNSCTSSH